MFDADDRTEMRRQKRLERYGTNDPICPLCGETDDRCFELHHPAGRRYDPQVILICKNCHAKCSDAQKDHPSKVGRSPITMEAVGRYLLGLADMLGAVAAKLKEFGLWLISEARRAVTDQGEAAI